MVETGGVLRVSVSDGEGTSEDLVWNSAGEQLSMRWRRGGDRSIM